MNRSTRLSAEVQTLMGFVERELSEASLDERAAFLEADTSHFHRLVEERGHDPVCRTLGRVFSMTRSRDEQVAGKARTVLDALAESAPPDMIEPCPVCEGRILKTFECATCGFSLIEDFRCPLISQDGLRRCRATGESCSLFGLEFESCDILERN